MLLADLGNTCGKFHLWRDAKLQQVAVWDYQQPVSELLAPYANHSLTFASVSSSANNTLLIQAAVALSMPIEQIKTESCRFGVSNGYQDVTALGVDRWLALIGARAIEQGGCIVIDAGTAVTIDVMDESGTHQGGWILPGLTLMMNALCTQTAALRFAATEQELALATNTASGISNGIFAAVTGAIEQAITVGRANLMTSSSAPQLFITGGSAPSLMEAISQPLRYEPDLVLQGLLRYAQAS